MGCPEIESTDQFEGIAPVPLRVRPDPGRPGKIIAVPLSLTAYRRVGFRRELSIETERDIQKRQNVMVVSLRLAFDERTGARSSASHTALQYNITGVA